MNDFQKTPQWGVIQGVKPATDSAISLSVAASIVERMLGQYQLMSAIMLNCGVHPKECVNLRVRHFNQDKRQLIVPNAAGFNVRTSFIPVIVFQTLVSHIDYLKTLHKDDLRYGFGQVRLPDSFANTDGRYSHDFGWQWLFSRRSLSLESSDINREKLILERLNRRINQAAKLLPNDATLAEVELDVTVFWKSYLAGISD